MSLHGVILAGGAGTRFWPISRQALPKQFLDFLGTGRTFIQSTFDRLIQLIAIDKIWIITHKDYFALVREQLPELPLSNILLEPERKNTAASFAYASYKIAQTDPGATVAFLPSDHFILKENKFLQILKKGYQFIQDKEGILTLGVAPTYPETGYGYIQTDIRIRGEEDILPILAFKEKPTIQKATEMLAQGNYYWNSGIYIYPLKAGLHLFETYAPIFHQLFSRLLNSWDTTQEQRQLEEIFKSLPIISFDYAIMEYVRESFMIPANIGWSDLGTWNSIYKHLERDEHENVILGKNIFLYEAQRNFVYTHQDLGIGN